MRLQRYAFPVMRHSLSAKHARGELPAGNKKKRLPLTGEPPLISVLAEQDYFT